MTSPFLERRGPWGITYALLILLVFFFLLPSAFQSARLSLNEKENDVKDWLPSDFPETVELDWFADHFVGESFVLATWPGCNRNDQRLKLLERKLRHESDRYDPSAELPAEVAEVYARARDLGAELQLLDAGQQFNGWGGRREKWLVTPGDRWYFVTPDGKLYRWDEPVNGPLAVWRAIRRGLGRYELQGQLVTAFRLPEADDETNPFYNDPSLLCAPLFHTVQTGESIVEELAREGGSLWPVDLTDESRRADVARRRAMDRLTGTLYAPPVPPGFDWSPEAFREQIPEERQQELPERFDEFVQYTVEQWIEQHHGGDRMAFLQATTQEQTNAWYHVFDELEIDLPPRQTCVLVTLTKLAQNNLTYAIGRGVMGSARGRLLVLAEESGLRAAPPPSLAPPPFNQADPDALAIDDEPAFQVGGQAKTPPLRLGGPPVDNIAIDEEGTVTLVRLVGYSVAVGLVLSYLCFRSIKLTVMVFVVGGSAAMLSMAIVGWTDGRVDAILMSMPSLVYVLGLSGAIHVVNYYRDEVRLRGRRGAAGRALRHAVIPCTLASVTTAIGLVSLFTSNLAPISNFGLYAALGVIATLAILFSYLPAALQTFPPSQTFAPEEEQAGVITKSALADHWANVGTWITRHHWLVTAACLIALVGVAVGIRKIQTTVQLLKLFDTDARIIRDYAWLEKNFGKLVPMELVVRVPPEVQAERGDSAHPLTMLQRAEMAARVRIAVERTLGESGQGIVGNAMSTDTFLPPLPEPTNRYSPTRAHFNRELLQSSDLLRDNDYLRIEQRGPYVGSELWRISLRVAALSDVDYGLFISTLRDVVEPVLRAYDTRDELLTRLAAAEENGAARSGSAPKILLAGGSRPASLREAELLQEDGETIDGDAVYLATLGELLSGEPLQKPDWIDPSAEAAAKLVTDERWATTLQRYDVVIWLGGEGWNPEHFAAAKQFINAQEFLHRDLNRVLLDGAVPAVEGTGALQAVYTGVVPVVYKSQRTLLTSLTESIGLAFVLIAGVMVFLLNPGQFPGSWFKPRNLATGFAAGVVSMIPNMFPVLLVFGAMGHAGILVGIGTMMTASVAMGVAVDDTIHFLSWFRAYLDEGKSRVEAVVETYRRVGPAMTQTTIVGGLGLFVFALSTFVPTQQFGTLMLILLATALIGDLIFLPALLVGPLGRFFQPREQPAPPLFEIPSEDLGTSDSHSSAASPPGGEVEEDSEAEVVKLHLADRRKDAPHGIKR